MRKIMKISMKGDLNLLETNNMEAYLPRGSDKDDPRGHQIHYTSWKAPKEVADAEEQHANEIELGKEDRDTEPETKGQPSTQRPHGYPPENRSRQPRVSHQWQTQKIRKGGLDIWHNRSIGQRIQPERKLDTNQGKDYRDNGKTNPNKQGNRTMGHHPTRTQILPRPFLRFRALGGGSRPSEMGPASDRTPGPVDPAEGSQGSLRKGEKGRGPQTKGQQKEDSQPKSSEGSTSGQS